MQTLPTPPVSILKGNIADKLNKASDSLSVSTAFTAKSVADVMAEAHSRRQKIEDEFHSHMTSMQAVHQASETTSAIVVSAFKDLRDALDPLIARSEQQEHLNLKTLFFFCGNDLAERYRSDRWGFRVKPNDWSRLCQAVSDNRAPSLLPSQAFSPANEASAIAFLATYLQEHAPAPMFSGPIDWNREARLAWAMLEMKGGRAGHSSSSLSLQAESDVVISRLDELAVTDCSSSLKDAFKHFRAEAVW